MRNRYGAIRKKKPAQSIFKWIVSNTTPFDPLKKRLKVFTPSEALIYNDDVDSKDINDLFIRKIAEDYVDKVSEKWDSILAMSGVRQKMDKRNIFISQDKESTKQMELL